jgi:hypothetical protein
METANHVITSVALNAFAEEIRKQQQQKKKLRRESGSLKKKKKKKSKENPCSTVTRSPEQCVLPARFAPHCRARLCKTSGKDFPTYLMRCQVQPLVLTFFYIALAVPPSFYFAFHAECRSSASSSHVLLAALDHHHRSYSLSPPLLSCNSPVVSGRSMIGGVGLHGYPLPSFPSSHWHW